MIIEKLAGIHGKFIDYHFYITNLFAIPAIIVMLMVLQDKMKSGYDGKMDYKQGLISGIVVSALIALIRRLTQ